MSMMQALILFFRVQYRVKKMIAKKVRPGSMKRLSGLKIDGKVILLYDNQLHRPVTLTEALQVFDGLRCDLALEDIQFGKKHTARSSRHNMN